MGMGTRHCTFGIAHCAMLRVLVAATPVDIYDPQGFLSQLLSEQFFMLCGTIVIIVSIIWLLAQGKWKKVE